MVLLADLLLLLLKAALVLGAAALLALAARRGSAAVRHGVWSLAFLGILALPFASAVLPPVPISIPVLSSLPAQMVSDVAVDRSVPAGAVATDGRNVGTRSERPSSSAGAEGFAGTGLVDLDPFDLLVAVWLTGVLLRMALIGKLYARTIRLRNLGHAGGSAAPERMTSELSRRLRIGRPVRVLTSERIAMPLTWGLARPVILLPTDAGDWPEDRLRSALLHELSHISRCDYLTALAAEVACALYWPVPLVWYARRRMAAEQEQACDDRVLAAGVPSVEYAEHLLAVARTFYGKGSALGLSVTMAREATLQRRVRAILSDSTDRRPLRSTPGWTLSAVILALVLPLAAAQAAPGPRASTDVADARTSGSSELSASSTPGPGSPPAAAPEPLLADGDIARAAAGPAALPATAGASYQLYEAESADLTGRARRSRDGDASGGRMVRFRSARGARSGTEAVFEFEAAAAGRYLVWGRVAAPDRHSNSFFVSLDGSEEIVWDAPRRKIDRDGTSWRWDRISARDLDGEPVDPVVYDLPAGRHSLRIRTREGGARLDAILITNDLDHRPRGVWPSELPAQPAHLVFEAESLDLSNSFAVGSDPATETSYIQVLDAAPGSGASPAAFARLRFAAPVAGLYSIWARTLVPDGRSDSIRLRVDQGDWIRWYDLPRGPRWTWSPVTDDRRDERLAQVPLEAGSHLLELAPVEPGVMIDRIVLTNDPLFSPDRSSE
ncbi:MAG: M56 family metallopeptidase [Gemmatimonadota bacterium]